VGYQLSAGGPATYCLEGSVAYAGLLVQWLRDNLQVGPNLSPYVGLLVPLNIPAHVARAP
jgi:glycerol kinase